MTLHAELSPSSAHRWMVCPGSIRLSRHIPRVSSKYADEGTAAHTLAALCLTTGTSPEHHVGEAIQVDATAFPVDEAMAAAVAEFTALTASYVEQGYALEVEVRLDLSHLAPGQFGTGDAVLYHDRNRHLVVADFKYGAGVPVFPENNPQLLSYASGAARRFDEVDSLSMIIVQPRTVGLAPIRVWQIKPPQLAAFEDEFRLAADRTTNPNAPLVSGEHCRFCPAAATCPALKGRALSIARAEFADALKPAVPTLPVPAELSPADLADVLAQAHLVDHWLTEVRAYALQQALRGNPPAGFKLVQKATHRKWFDEVQVATALTMACGLSAEDIYTDPKLKSPAQIEKLLGKQAKRAIAPLVSKPDGEPMLAPLADSRPAIAVDPTADFAHLLQASYDLTLTP